MMRGWMSLLIGAHQFVLHPIWVLAGWWRLYGRPSWPEIVAIVVHDWGYAGRPSVEGPEALDHPELGARIARRLGGEYAAWLVRGHSRAYAYVAGIPPSPLCWADKLAFALEPWWLYIPRAWLAGELRDYGARSAGEGHRDPSWRTWHARVRVALVREVRETVGGVANV